MKRRSALLTMAGTVGALVGLPAWATGWTSDTVRPIRPLLSHGQNDLLADIVETIIPATDTPGAKALKVHQFVAKVVTDCYDKPAQETLQKGLSIAAELAQTTFNKPFGEGEATQRIGILTQMSQSTDAAPKDFYRLVKDLTIRGYLNSEYVMTNLTHYEMVPGRYHGCVPVATK